LAPIVEMAAFAEIIVLVGATASGKSAAAVLLAERIDAEILSIDSMQVYCGMNLGTAKPSREERLRVPHHLIDIVAPNQEFTVARFVAMADDVIRSVRKRGKRIVATGGTPLYYKALFEGIFDGPAANAEVRSRLRALPNKALHEKLSRVDPSASARIHVNDTKRLVRALEVYELTGHPISSMQTEWGSAQPRHQARWFGLAWDRDMLNRRINARVREMIEAGWADETRRLLAQYGALSPTAAEATGYRELVAHLRGELSLDDAIEQIKIATRQLARRQMKWFRRFPDVSWLDGNIEPGRLADQIIAAMSDIRRDVQDPRA
jgi:tRNA dimethylallyltransferase